MAISGSDGSITLTTKVDQGGINKALASIKTGVAAVGAQAAKVGAAVAKSFLIMSAAAGAAAVAITKQAASAYADYEQLVGGIETLFKDSAKKVIAYAENAFYTAGVSANEYMQTAIGVSASLIQSLGGDTAKAADIANMAIVDMSDNVNKLGTDMERVQMAYAGFARNQYQLLDNLALGYQGTKTEMERLLRDAEAYMASQGKAVKYNINNLSDVYSAIHAIQEKIGVAGTTVAEAEKTITGAANMVKAAWKNVLTAISGGGDLDRAMKNLAYSIQKYFNNIVPVVERTLAGIGTLIEGIAPTLVQTVARSFIKAIPTLINAVYSMILGTITGISDAFNELLKGGEEKQLEKQTEEIEKAKDNQNALKDAVEETEKAQKGALAGFDEINTLTSSAADEAQDMALNTGAGGATTSPIITPEVDDSKAKMTFAEFIRKLLGEALPRVASTLGLIISTIFDALPSLVDSIVENTPAVISAILSLLENIVKKLPSIIKKLTSTFPTLFPQIFTAIVNLIDLLISNLDGILQPIVDSIPDTLITITEALTSNLPTIIRGIISLVMSIVKFIPQILRGISDAVPTVIELLITALLQNLPLIIMGLIQVVAGIIVSLPEIFGSMLDAIVGVFVGIWNALTNVFGDVGAWIDEYVIQPIIGFFAKLWKNIENGLKSFANFFVDAINGVIGVVESFANFFVNAINWIIEGINKISFDVPDWVPGIGGKKFGFNLKRVNEGVLGRIPRLAQGTVVPPNREFMAILGDNKKETEIVSPLSTMKEAFIEAMATVGMGRNQDTRPIVLQVDSREIAVINRQGDEKLGTQTVFGGFANAY